MRPQPIPLHGTPQHGGTHVGRRSRAAQCERNAGATTTRVRIEIVMVRLAKPRQAGDGEHVALGLH